MVWKDGVLHMLDQRTLPGRTEWLELRTWQGVAEAINDMAVRGAPAIGVAAAYGMVLAAQQGADLEVASQSLAATRPTAVNLFWALDRMRPFHDQGVDRLLAEARAIEAEDLAGNENLGRLGAALLPPQARILTVCNTGSLATAGHGTALGIIRSAFAADPSIFVYSCETRPRQQGLRLTAYELTVEGIPFKSIVDGAAASLMSKGMVDCVIVGADRIAANGDTANKIGTYSLAVLADFHKLPFYVAAPESTFDPSIPDGSAIPIEERSGEEITVIEGQRVAPESCPTWNPGFDVTPATLITAIISERAVYRRPFHFRA